MTSPFGSFIDQLSYWYYLYIVPVGFDPAKPNGTGPFKFQSFTAGQQSTFIKNPNYWKPGLPYLDSVTIIDFADSAALQNALVANQIDAAGALEGAQLKVLSTNPAIKTVASRTGSITPFTMRVDQEPFKDVRVRQAFRFMVNRKELISAALDGYAFAGADVSSPFDADYNSSFHRDQDISKAKSLLQAAGKSGLSVDLTTAPAATGMVQMATVFAQQAKQAGVTVNLKPVDPPTFFGPNYLQWTFSQDFYNYSPYLAQVAQSLLPTSPFSETAGTFVSCEGRVQSFKGVVKPYAETRPGWKILRRIPIMGPVSSMNRGQSSPSSNESTVPDTAPTANKMAVPLLQRLASSR